MKIYRLQDVPQYLMQDRNWSGALHIIGMHEKLHRLLSSLHFNFETGVVKFDKMKEIAKPWSSSERFMLDLAAHLFNPTHKVDISGLADLDRNNYRIAMDAINKRYGPR